MSIFYEKVDIPDHLIPPKVFNDVVKYNVKTYNNVKTFP